MIRPVFLSMILLFVACTHLYARDGKISGKVTDAQNEPLTGVNVLIINAGDDKLIKADITNDSGKFAIEELPNGNYVVKVTSAIYEEYRSEAITLNNNEVQVKTISLKDKSNALKEVSVRAQKPLIEIKADKLVVNVENSIVNAGSSVMDVLARSPGVHVDQNDNISLKGKQGVFVMIDGKKTVMQGTDLASLLKSMSSSSIEQIEIITNPSAKYDAAGTAGIINIKTKKDKRYGFNGSLNCFYTQGVYPKFGGGTSINYRNKKWTVNGGVNYADRYGFNHLTLYRSFYNGDKLQNAYDQDNNGVFGYNLASGNVSVDYSLSSKTTIGIAANTDVNWYKVDGDNFSKVLGPDKEIQSYFTTLNNSDNHSTNYGLNLNMRHKFDSSGKELSVDVDYGAFNATRLQDFTTRYLDVTGQDYLPQYLLHGDLSGLTTIRSFKADYTHPLKNKLQLDGGIKLSYVTQDNDVQFFDRSIGGNVFDTSKSNHFVYKENINAAYLNMHKDWVKWSTQIGVRVEQTIAKGEQKINNQSFDRNYAQLFPSFAVQRHINANNDLGLTLSRRINRPNYEQLNPFKYYLDPSTYRTGYPFLLPELIYNIELSHTYKQRFVTTFLYSYLTDPITEVIQPSDDTNQKRVTVQTDKNLTSQVFFDLSGTYQFSICKWWTNVTQFNCYYSEFHGDIANTVLNAGTVTVDINTSNSLVLGKDWSAELGFNYQSRQIYGYMNLLPTWNLNAGIQKNLFDKRATIKLNATDIFWKSYPRATSVYNNYTESFVAQRDTRQVTLSFVYRFGSKSVSPVRRHSGGAEDLKRRASSGNA